MNSQVKILFLTDSLFCGGKERQLTELVRGLVSSGRMSPRDIAVVSMAPEGHFDKTIEKAGVRLFRLCRSWRFDPLLTLRLRKLLKELQPRVLFSFSAMATTYSALARLALRTKLVDGSIRDAVPFSTAFSQLRGRFNFRAADLIVANSKAGLVAKGAPAGKSRVLYNGFDIARLQGLEDPGLLRKALGVETPWAVGMVAAFWRNKDWETFFLAARVVLTKRCDVTFVAVGEGDQLEAYQRRFGAQRGILFTGRQARVDAILGALNVGVLCTSAVHAEGISNAIMEYMATGLPVVVTAGGGTAELVMDRENGFVVGCGDPELVADKILYLIDNHEAARRMGGNGRTRIQQHFSLETAVSRFVEICREAAGNGSDSK